ncbi:MAG: Flp pilus assembly complex ATPase component TadA [Phycisphaerae bacterium]|nr:Flp pilus assembly complex ATPase component TadA [Phycisphaerae bacterium]
MDILLADVIAVGEYFSPIKIVIMLVMIIPWMLAAPWLQRDAKRMLLSPELWGGVALGAGALGFVLWLAMPTFILGMLAYLVVVGATFGAYIVYRNGRCAEGTQITFSSLINAMGKGGGEATVEVITRVKLYAHSTKIVLAPREEASLEDRLAYNETQDLLFDLLFHRASEADLTPTGETARLRLAIDGVVTEHEPLEAVTCDRVIQYLKDVGGMDVEERRRPQTGMVAADLLGKHTDIMLTVDGTRGGQRMKFRIVDEAARTDLGELGLSPDTLEQIQAAAASTTGLIIVSGRPRNGVTSTLYSLLRKQDAFIKQLMTIEFKPLVDLENVTQNTYDSDEDLPKLVAATARRDPDVIMVDRCPDQTTADLIRRIAETKLVLLGMQAKDPFVALAKWAKACGNVEQALAPLLGISCQLLIRKLCLECRHPYKPDPQLLAKVNISGRNIDVFYKRPPKGRTDEKGKPLFCNACQESGFHGRTGVFEFLQMTDDIKALVAGGADVRAIKAACRKNKMLNRQEQALRKVIAGVTSINEVIRVTQESKKKK